MDMKFLALSMFTATAMLTSFPSYSADQNTNVVSKANDTMTSVDSYWTAERMRNAKPMPLPQANPRAGRAIPKEQLSSVGGDSDGGDGAPPSVKLDSSPEILFKMIKQHDAANPLPGNRGTSNEDFSSSRLVPITADTTYPYSTVGKLFFTIPNRGDFVCSASVLRPRVLVTAGHCVHSGSGGTAGFYTNWKFVPAFRNGAAPFKTWNWSYVTTTNTWATGGGVVPNAADYAMFEMADQAINGVTQKLGSITGYLGYQTLALIPNHTHMLGYPCNLDSCAMMHQVTAQSAKAVSPNNAEYGSDAGGGSSGGPWVQNFGVPATGQTAGNNTGVNRVVGVTSYGYTSPTPLAQGAAIPDSRFITLLNTICGHKAGNC